MHFKWLIDVNRFSLLLKYWYRLLHMMKNDETVACRTTKYLIASSPLYVIDYMIFATNCTMFLLRKI